MISTSDVPVLVADDEWIIRHQMARALGALGILCDCAVNGDDALKQFRGSHHRVVVTDLRMPQCNGHSLALSLLAEPKPPKVVVVTGVREPKLSKDLLARGVNDIIFKPIKYGDLAIQIEKALKTAHSERSTPSDIPTEALTHLIEGADLPSESDERTREDVEERLLRSPPRIEWLTMALRWFDWHEVSDPPEIAHELLQKQSCVGQDGASDRRQEPRAPLAERAIAVPLDSDFKPIGEPFKLLLRDLSRQGIRMVHTRQVDGSHLALMWRNQEMQRVVALVRIIRCQQQGNLFDIGSLFVP
jgi:CheY-like chemotaxis protein